MARTTIVLEAMWMTRIPLLGLCALAVLSCTTTKPSCPGGGTLVERYYAFEATDKDTPLYYCPPEGDCNRLCERLAIDLSINGQTPMTGSVVVCEWVRPPDGWSDAGFQGWDDAGYSVLVSGDGGVDPNRVLHLIARISPFCGT
jgi:hypothetical protein